MTGPVIFQNFKREKFPFDVTIRDADTGEILQQVTVTGEGAVPITGHQGHRLSVFYRFADGTLDSYTEPYIGAAQLDTGPRQ